MVRFRWVGLVAAAAALALGGCSDTTTSDDDDAGNGTGGSSASGGTGGGGTAPEPCGSLSIAEASDIATYDLAGVLHNSAEALRFLEHSALVERGYYAPDSGDSFVFADDANASIDEFVDDLRTNVFAEANVESETGNSVTYHLTPEVNCPLDEDYASFDPEGAMLEQQDCIADLEAHPARYTVSRVYCDEGDSVSITLEIGEARIKPGVLTVSPNTLALGVDVAETLRAVEDGDPSATFDADSGGTVTARLEAPSADSANFVLSLDTKVVIGALDNDEPARLAIDESPNALQLTASSGEGRLSGALVLQATDVTLPLHDLIESAFNREVQPDVPSSDTVKLHLYGPKGGFDLDRTTEQLVLSAVTLGIAPATVRSGSDTLLTVDVNGDSGRTLTVLVEVDADDQPRLSAFTGFDLDLGYALAPVADKVVDLWPFAFDDQVKIALTGSSPGATFMRDEDGVLSLLSRVTGPQMRVDAGSFVMTSEAYPDENVSVETEQCLLYDGTLDGEHDILRGYYGDDCP